MENDLFENLLRQALEVCDLTSQEIEDVVDKFPMPSFIQENLKADSAFFNFKEKTHQSARLMGVKPSVFIQAAVKQPPLFYQKPKTISGHAKLMQQFNERGIIKPDVQDFYLKNPAFLCLANDNFKLRLTFADHAGIQGSEDFSLLRRSRKKVEADMVEILGYDPSNKNIDAHANSNSAQLIIDMVDDKRIKGFKIT